MAKNNLAEITEIWRKYQLGVDHHNEEDLYESTAKAWRFYEGDQWYGVTSGGNFTASELPSLNFIAPAVDYKFVTVVQQNIKMIFNEIEKKTPDTDVVTRALNKYAERKWELLNFDSLVWRLVKRACIAGDDYVYFYNKNLDCQLVDNTSIYFSDEQEPDIQKQEYIIIQERRPVATIRREAEKNGVKKKDIEMIVADQLDETTVGNRVEVDDSADGGKCLSLLMLKRNEEGFVTFSRSTKYVTYEPEKTINGMEKYPIAHFGWNTRQNSARGMGEVRPLIANQIEINRLLVRRSIAIKQSAFPKPVYNENAIDNPVDVDRVGKSIRVRGNINNIKDAFGYIAASPLSPEASNFQQFLLDSTRNLSGSGDAATGNVNPERAAASAIIAIRDQAALPMNMHLAEFKQFNKDVGRIWLDMWTAYDEDRVTYTVIDFVTPFARIAKKTIEKAEISKGDLKKVKLDIKIDATPTTPYSVYATEQALQLYEQNGKITFEEYVEALPANSISPKNTLQRIIERRRSNPQGQAGQMNQTGQPGKVGTNVPMSQGQAQPTTVMSRPSRG